MVGIGVIGCVFDVDADNTGCIVAWLDVEVEAVVTIVVDVVVEADVVVVPVVAAVKVVVEVEGGAIVVAAADADAALEEELCEVLIEEADAVVATAAPVVAV